jgi:parallel beta-helix repeat protein
MLHRLVPLAGLFKALILFAAMLLAQTASAIDVTTVGVIPDDGLDDWAAIDDALQNYAELYFPPGEYRISDSLEIPSNRTMQGAGMDEVTIELLTDTHAIMIYDVQNVTVSGLTINRSFDNSEGAGIAIQGGSNNTLVGIAITSHRSRDVAIRGISTAGLVVRDCVVTDYQRHKLEDGHVWTFGGGIALWYSTNCVIVGNHVEETRDMTISSPTVFNYYQAEGIGAHDCTSTVVACNTVIYTGEGIDMGGSSQCVVKNNYVQLTHASGIKLVNGSTDIQVIGNRVKGCGITGVWLQPGNTSLGIEDCLVDNNVFNNIGRSMEPGYWAGTFEGTIPSGVHLDAGDNAAGVSDNNTITNNDFYNNGDMVDAVHVREGTYAAINTTMTNNTEVSGDPPVFDDSACPPFDTVWVDPNAFKGGTGTEMAPFDTLHAGVIAVNVGGTVKVAAGETSETLHTAKPLQLAAVGGSARIGVIAKGYLNSDGSALHSIGGADGTSPAFADGNAAFDEFIRVLSASFGEVAEGAEVVIRDSIVRAKALPYTRASDGSRLAGLNTPLAIRLRGEAAVDPASVWGGPVSGILDVRAVEEGDLRDIWVVVTPDESAYLEGMAELAVAGLTVAGNAVQSETYRFRTDADAEVADTPALPELGLDVPHVIQPEEVYGEPQRIWLPVPAGVNPRDVHLYYYHADGDGRGWYPAENVENWLVPESYEVTSQDGDTYLGFLVRHAGIVQLGKLR